MSRTTEEINHLIAMGPLLRQCVECYRHFDTEGRGWPDLFALRTTGFRREQGCCRPCLDRMIERPAWALRHEIVCASVSSGADVTPILGRE